MRARIEITAMALAALFALSAVGASSAQGAWSIDVGGAGGNANITANQIAGTHLSSP